ncbi:tachykinin-like peptides receptor 86C [Leptinotarsa decemlineata]|uniref:tachykinin-like peptides receptor 86C n=1 Tax=Leptinotarsa decemlineata TaxID=7539 RepID=UPI000C25316C|nr:gastrin/cholecystokinin type B receptor-like [Leptinotarsa decemlineata]
MNNTTKNPFTDELILSKYRDNYYDIIGLYVPLFFTAFCANVIVIIVVFRDQYMRSVTNYFLVNLSIADLLVTLVCMPNAAWLAYTTMYPFGKLTCKISPYLQCIAVSLSIFTITAMALDRYLAITRPFGMIYRSFSKTTTVVIIIALWVMSLVLFSPILFIYRLREDFFPTDLGLLVSVCIEDWSLFPISQSDLGIVWFVFMFAMPGVIMLFAYSMMGRTLCSGKPPFDNDSTSTQQRNKLIKGRKRVACILLLLAFVFALCWLPYHLMTLMADLGTSTGEHTKQSKRYLRLLGHANSALNPIIYCALSRKFRRSIKNLFCVKMTFKRRRQIVKWADSSGSGTQLHYMQRLKNSPNHMNQLNFNTSRRQSSQKTTKTFAV